MGRVSQIWKRHRRKIVGAVALLAAAAITPPIAYTVNHTKGEYRTLQLLDQLHAQEGIPTDDREISTLMAMVRKESSFYRSAIGRDREVGLLQLQASLAQDRGLQVQNRTYPHSEKLEELFYLEPEGLAARDQRFDAGENLRIGAAYFHELAQSFERTYGMAPEPAREFGMIAYNLGVGNVRKLLRNRYSTDPGSFIARLATENLSAEGISDRKRRVAVEYYTKNHSWQATYATRLADMRAQGDPGIGQYIRAFPSCTVELVRRTLH